MVQGIAPIGVFLLGINQDIDRRINARTPALKVEHFLSAAHLRAKGLVFHHEKIDVGILSGTPPGARPEKQHLGDTSHLPEGMGGLLQDIIGHGCHSSRLLSGESRSMYIIHSPNETTTPGASRDKTVITRVFGREGDNSEH
jgi:hypothetical protein